MDRTSELLDIYRQSGLNDLLDVNPPPRYFEEEQFTKLLFIKNEFGVTSIELHDLKNGGVFFRIHHREAAPQWLREALRSWPNIRTSARVGTNYDGDPLIPAKALAALLSGHRGKTLKLQPRPASSPAARYPQNTKS